MIIRRTTRVGKNTISYAECCEHEEKTWLLIHGLAGSSANWLKFMELVERRLNGVHVIAPDLLGHGASSTPAVSFSASMEAEAMSEFMSSLGYYSFSVMGNSLGGWIAMLLALKGHVGSQVLVDSGGMPLSVIPCLDPNDEDEARALLARIFSTPQWRTQEMASKLMQARNRGMKNVIRSFLSSQERFMSWSDISKINVPTLLVWGSDDRLIPVELGRLLSSRIKRSKMIILNGLGHEPMLEDPEAFFLAVSEWIRYW
ncbi:MAG: alpha/beta fold hydrolase [Thermoprotei archaeon]|nr:alpha/beta hydrolase [TACK group archaeon]